MYQIKIAKISIVSFFIIILMISCDAFSDTSAKIEVAFDGKDCTVTGPSELPPGEHTFTFIDQSEWEGELWLVYLDEGKTIQDQLDLQSEPGEWHPKPSWVHYDSNVSRESKEKGDVRIDTETWRLNRVGEHNILCYVDTPQLIWFAAPLMIVENPSE